MLSDPYEKNFILLLQFMFAATVFTKSYSYQCELSLFSGLGFILISKYISNFHFEIFLRKNFFYCLRSESGWHFNGNSSKMLKER